MRYSVVKNGNTVKIQGDLGGCSFELGSEFTSERSDFAAWAALPLAMRKGENLVIEGIGDSVVAANATKLSEIWELWMPEWFTRVQVSFSDPRPMPEASGRLLLFSGGVDSTSNLLRHEQVGSRPHLLTLHGLDYRHSDEARFAGLLEQTQPLVDRAAAGRHTVRTDIYDLYRKSQVDVAAGHGFALFSGLFLFADQFGVGEISADYSAAQDYVVSPWGTNSLTNPMYASSTFHVATASADATRSDKVALLAKDHVALRALTFCKDYSKRPKNCGVCSKCTRTKAMFIAVTGEAPDIFIDRRFDPKSLATIKLSSRSEAAFFVDLYLAARRNGNLDRLPGLERAADAYFRAVRLKNLNFRRRVKSYAAAWIQRIGVARKK